MCYCPRPCLVETMPHWLATSSFIALVSFLACLFFAFHCSCSVFSPHYFVSMLPLCFLHFPSVGVSVY